jgi:hypothetical protein
LRRLGIAPRNSRWKVIGILQPNFGSVVAEKERRLLEATLWVNGRKNP